jgi:hypothetical protein
MAPNVRTGTGNGCRARVSTGPTIFNHRDPTNQIPGRLAMRILQLVRVDPIPNLACEKPAGYPWLVPKRIRGKRSSAKR